MKPRADAACAFAQPGHPAGTTMCRRIPLSSRLEIPGQLDDSPMLTPGSPADRFSSPQAA